MGDLAPAIPDAEPDSGPFLQAQPEPEEEGANVAQAALPGMDQAISPDPVSAPPEVDRLAWDERSEPTSRQAPSQPEQAADGPMVRPEARPAEAVPRPPSAVERSSRAGDVSRATAVQRAASQDTPATTPAAGDGQADGQPGVASLPPVYPAGEQPGRDLVMSPSSADGELPTQPFAGQEPASLPAAAEPQLNLQSAQRDPWPALPQAAQPEGASVQSEEEPPGQVVPAAEAGSVQRTLDGKPEATPGDRAASSPPPHPVPEIQNGHDSLAQAQPEDAGLRRTDTLPPQAEAGEEDVPTGDQSERPAAAPTLAETVEGDQAQPAEIGRESIPPTEVTQGPVLSIEARQEPAPPTQVSRRPILPVEVGSAGVPPPEVRQGSISPVEARQGAVPPTELTPGPVAPVEAKQEAAPPTEVRRMPAPASDTGLIQRSPAPRAQPPLGVLPSAKRRTGGTPGAAGQTVVNPKPEGSPWGDSTQATGSDAPAVIQAQPAQAQAEAADESPAPAAAPPSSVSPVAINSAPPMEATEADVDRLARQVYQILRRRLQIEYERNLGHGR
jgi:hypothetical protein